MTQHERDRAILDPLITQLSEEMVSLGHLTYVINQLAKHYIPVPASHVNLIGIFGTLEDCAMTFHREQLGEKL